jgi:hypothetical protein
MTNPITPPPELLRKWCAHNSEHENYEQFWHYIAAQAAQWGADTELEACVNWLDREGWSGESRHLRNARRPKPPSLAKRALHILGTHGDLSCAEHDTIRRALEALND